MIPYNVIIHNRMTTGQLLSFYNRINRISMICFFAPGGQDRWGGGAALQGFLELEVRLEPSAKWGEEEGGDVVGKVLVAQVLPGSIL